MLIFYQSSLEGSGSFVVEVLIQLHSGDCTMHKGVSHAYAAIRTSTTATLIQM